MKRFLVTVLALSLVVCIFFSQFLSASAVEVTVGQTFAWNDSSANPQAWIQSKGVSPDGLWKYQFYALEKGIYQDLNAVYSNGFAWSTNPGNYGLGYARVRNNGVNFHPGETADVVKTFICPAGGVVEIASTMTRYNEVSYGTNGSSFAVYLEDVLVYPSDGTPFLVMETTSPYHAVFDLEVKAGQQLHFHIGSINGHSMNDSTDMTNTVTYKSVNGSSVPPVQTPEITPPQDLNPGDIILETPEPDVNEDTSDVPTKPEPDSDTKDEVSSSKDDKKDEDNDKNAAGNKDKADDKDEKDGDGESSGLSAGLIALIAYGSVGVLILASVVVLIIVSKKK